MTVDKAKLRELLAARQSGWPFPSDRALVKQIPALLAENDRLERACRLAVMALAHACQESERGEALYGKTYKAVSDALYSPAPPQGDGAC